MHKTINLGFIWNISIPLLSVSWMLPGNLVEKSAVTVHITSLFYFVRVEFKFPFSSILPSHLYDTILLKGAIISFKFLEIIPERCLYVIASSHSLSILKKGTLYDDIKNKKRGGSYHLYNLSLQNNHIPRKNIRY